MDAAGVVIECERRRGPRRTGTASGGWRSDTMAIIELHLDRPALKRVEAPSGERASDVESTVEWPEEATEEESGGGIGRKLLLAVMVAAIGFAVIRWRRGGREEEAAIDIGTEETRPETE